MNTKLLIVLLCLIICIEARKTSRSRGSGSSRGTSSRKSNSQPAPTSLSYPQPSASKPSGLGWQEKPAQRSQSLPNWQAKPSSGQGHSYPSSNTGLSGNNNAKQPSPSLQENHQKSNAPAHQGPPHSSHPNNQPSHSYPASNGLSGVPGSGSSYPGQSSVGSGQHASPGGYPQQPGSGLSGTSGGGYPHSGTGLSGAGAGYPQQPGSSVSNTGVAPPPYSGYNRPGAQNVNSNYGNNYNPQRQPPPPYHNYGSNYGGYGGGPPYNPGPQMPGYFGNYGNNGKGFGGMSRTGSALTGVGIAGAGVGTILTGLALWNLARSTGKHHHTVVYDNRGQPVAVAPADSSATAVDPMLANLVNCSLTISNGNTTEILAIPCAIATSFSPDADVKLAEDGSNGADNTKCTVTVLTKTGKEYMTTIPCSTLLNTAAENNVTEPAVTENETNLNSTIAPATDNTDEPNALKLTGDATDTGINNSSSDRNCDPQPGDIRDPINPCYAVTHNLTVIPLQSTVNP